MRNKTCAWNIEIVFTCRAFIHQLIAAAVRIYTHTWILARALTDKFAHTNPFSSNFPIWLRSWLTLNGSAVVFQTQLSSPIENIPLQPPAAQNMTPPH